MSVLRITKNFDINTSDPIVIIYGNIKDSFIDNNLKLYKNSSLERILWTYLKKEGYERILYYDDLRMLYVYDTRSAELCFLNPQSHLSSSNSSKPQLRSRDDKRPLGGKLRWLKTKKKGNFSYPTTPSTQQNRRGKRMKNHIQIVPKESSAIGIIKHSMEDDTCKTAIIFSQYHQLGIQNTMMIQLDNMMDHWNSQDTDNRCIILSNAVNKEGLSSYLSRMPVLNALFTNHEEKETNPFPSVLKIETPQIDEIKFLLNRFRLLGGVSLDWNNIDRISKGVYRKKNSLKDWYKILFSHSQKNNHSIQYDLLVRESIIAKTILDDEEKNINPTYLQEKLSMVKCQEDNVQIIEKNIITFFNKKKKKYPYSFFLVGTSGVGKTFTTELVAEALENNGYEYVYFAMSEYQDEHSRSKIIGPPPGYVGSNAKPKLLEHIEDNSRLIICFDEIEKGHPEILKTLMQLLDKGVIGFNVNGKSIEGDFRQCIIFFTSNAEMEKLTKQKSDFQKQGKPLNNPEFQKRIMKILQDAKISPELTGRINKYLVYNPLTPKSVIEITHQEINRLNEDVEVIYTDIEYLARTALESAGSITGARDIKNKIASTLEEDINVLNEGKYIVQKINEKYQLIPYEQNELPNSYEEMIQGALERYKRIKFEAFYLDTKSIEKELSKVYGQQDNIAQIIEQLELWYPKRKKTHPLSFFLVGTSGVGKTFTAKQLTKALSQGGYEDELIYFDMNDFQSPSDINKLKGSAKGFAGSNEKPRIFEALDNSKNRKLVICFDEIEKAHPNILTSFMQLLDEGFMEWNKGKGDFKNCILFFTSNAQMEQLVAFKQQFKTAQKEVKSLEFQNKIADLLVKAEIIKSEVSGRIGKFLIYNPLEEQDILRIAFQEIQKLAQSYSIQRVVWTSPKLLAQIAIQTTGHIHGVRPIKKLIESELGKVLSKFSTQYFNEKEVAITFTKNNEYKAIPAIDFSPPKN